MDKVFLLLFITLTSLLCSSSSQRCLESRLDFRSCHYKNDDSKLNIPDDNKYSVYFTKLKGLHCLIRNNTMFKKTTATIEDHDTKDVKILYSPGFLHNEKYSNQMLVYYNVKCDVGREKIFFDILDMDLQGADCEYDPNTNVCEDYILIDRTQYGTDEFCGNNIPEISPKNLADGNVRITFRTSELTRRKGFRMYVICYDQTKQNDKRKRNVGGGEPCFNVDEFNSKVCTNATIQKLTNTKYSITDLFSDPTYYPNCTKQSPRQIFQHQQRVQGRSCHKPTPPPIMYDLDPNNLPNKEEQGELTKMVTSFLSSVPDKRYQDDFEIINDTETLESITLSKPLDCIEISKIPRIVHESREIGNGGDNRTTLFAALRNQNACNPVLRAGANAILTFFRNNSEMESLKMFPIHCTEHTNLTVSCQSDYTTLPGRTQCKVDDKMCFNCEPFSGEPISVAEYKGKTMKVTAINCNGQRAEAVIRLNH